MQEPEKKFAAMFAGQCLPMGSDGVGECQGRRTKRGGRTGPSSFQSAALPTELPGQTAPLNNVGGSGTLCRKLCRSICADGCTWCSSVRKPAKKTAARHSRAEFGDRWSTPLWRPPRYAPRPPTPRLTSAACAATVSVTVSGATFCWSAARLAERGADRACRLGRGTAPSSSRQPMPLERVRLHRSRDGSPLERLRERHCGGGPISV